jgi:uncharacterized protein (TIGR03790 family)
MLRWIIGFLVLSLGWSADAIEPTQLCLIVNSTEPESLPLAKFYCQQRGVPLDNIFNCDVTTEDEISRDDYEAKLLIPLQKFLAQKPAITTLVSIYGMPLRVAAPAIPFEQRAAWEPLQKDFRAKEKLYKEKTDPAVRMKLSPMDQAKLDKDLVTLKASRDDAEKLMKEKEPKPLAEAMACVDSELMLVKWEKYDLKRFIFNPLHWQFPESKRAKLPPVMMTARIDGPTPAIAKRLIIDALATEKTGLKGKVYVDARGLKPAKSGDPGWGYEGYDDSMIEMADLLKGAGKMDVTLDRNEALFPVDSCKDCALYCGWYQLNKFQDCCEFAPGAIAWHLASLEAVTIKKETTGWCKGLLLKGATATLGPVAEPYTAGFPKPAEFFGFLATGEMTLVEAYTKTQLLTSWMTVLIGDPLYNPYKNSPKLKLNDVKPSPKWGKYLEKE